VMDSIVVERTPLVEFRGFAWMKEFPGSISGVVARLAVTPSSAVIGRPQREIFDLFRYSTLAAEFVGPDLFPRISRALVGTVDGTTSLDAVVFAQKRLAAKGAVGINERVRAWGSRINLHWMLQHSVPRPRTFAASRGFSYVNYSRRAACRLCLEAG
jgi:hypothetical protein